MRVSQHEKGNKEQDLSKEQVLTSLPQIPSRLNVVARDKRRTHDKEQ
jgi:hypothetical protein